jgi:hypothetical protein
MDCAEVPARDDHRFERPSGPVGNNGQEMIVLDHDAERG